MSTFIYPPTPPASGGATEVTLLQVEQNTADTVTELQTLNTNDFATEAKQDTQITALNDINSELDSQTAELVAANASLDAIEADVATIAATDFATEAKQDAQIVEAVATNASLDAIEADIDELNARLAGNLVPEAFDYLALTYVTVGNGIGEIETVVYKTGGSGGTTVATLTLAYDANDKLSSVTRT